MTSTSDEHDAAPGLLTNLAPALKWLLLVLLSVAIGGVLEWLHFPAGLLLGPMIASIIFAANGARLSLPRLPFVASQALIGTMIAGNLDREILSRVLDDWAVFLAIVLAVVLASSLIGYVLAKRQILPGTTAVWGTSAGAASVMVLMADAYGADARLVAFMQYLRVVCVASTATLMAAFVFNISGGTPPPFVLFPPVNWLGLGQTIAATAFFSYAGYLLRIPAGPMILPMAGVAVVASFGLITIELPPWLLALAYAMVGWRIGLAFTRRLLRHAARALPQVLLSIALLIGLGGCLAFLLWWLLDIDPLTAYLATSPGGLDSVAIIAASTHVDMPFVLALQTLRFLVILALGPPISRFVANRIG